MPPDQGPRDAISAVRQARLLAEAGQFGEYLSGASAYDLWIALLEADDDSDLMREQIASHKVEDAGLPILNNYCFQALVHAREAAGPYLRRRASEMEGEASRAVQEAAICYDGAAAALKAVGRAKWNTESRRKQAMAMREAKEFEARAAVLLGQALVP
jgi:hypothetical protein